MKNRMKNEIGMRHLTLIVNIIFFAFIYLYIYSNLWQEYSRISSAQAISIFALVGLMLMFTIKLVLTIPQLAETAINLWKILLIIYALVLGITFYIYTGKNDILIGMFFSFIFISDKVKQIFIPMGIVAMSFFYVQLFLFFNNQVYDTGFWKSAFDATQTRSAIGYSSPNGALQLFVAALLAWYFIENKVYKSVYTFFLMIASLAIILITYNRTILILLIVLMLYPILDRAIKTNWFKIFFPCSFPLLIVLSVILSLNLNNPLVYLINRLLSNRVNYWSVYINNFNGVNFLGKSAHTVALQEIWNPPLDNFYIYTLVIGGVILACLMSIFFYGLSKKIYQNQRFVHIFIMMEIYWISESIFSLTSIGLIFCLLPLILNSNFLK